MPSGDQEKCNRKSTSVDASNGEHGTQCQYPVMKLSNAIGYSELFYKHLTWHIDYVKSMMSKVTLLDLKCEGLLVSIAPGV